MIWFIYFWRFWGSRAVLLFIRATVPGMCPRWRVLAGQLSVAVRLSWPHMLLGSYQKRDTIFVLFNLCAIPYSKFQRHTSFIYNIIYMYVCVCLWAKTGLVTNHLKVSWAYTCKRTIFCAHWIENLRLVRQHATILFPQYLRWPPRTPILPAQRGSMNI